MKTRSLFGMLLMFLLTIGFISCNDDDKQEYHLKISGNSCEVMQGRSVTVNLTAHENTTLNIVNSELIDALYTWEFGEYKAKIEIKGKQKGETDIVVTDHESGESATIKVIVMEYPMPHLAVKTSTGNIFDMMDFYIYNEDSQSTHFNDLSAVCDSIVWTADGLNGSFRIFEHEEGKSWVDDHLTWKWGHCFKYPGEYKTYLTAWKDNKKVFCHQLDVTVTDDKDFLGYNWSDITKDSQRWTTYVDVFKSSPNLMTTYGLSGTVPFVEVRFFSNDIVQNYHKLYDYVCKLYSDPTYGDKKDKMWQLYGELFSEQKKYSGSPVFIWVTERANIVLLRLDDFIESSDYVIYAEPKK